MQRRDFLRRSAYAAGAAGAAASLPLNLLLGRGGAQRGARRRASCPAQHADRPRRRADDGEPVLRPLLRVAAERRRRAEPHLPGPGQRQRARSPRDTPRLSGRRSGRAAATPTPAHGWDDGRDQLGTSRANPNAEPDGFLAGCNDEFALCYYDEGDLGFIHPAGREFTIYDRFHCSLMASTWPNRYYKWSAQSGGLRNNDPPAATARQPVGDHLRSRDLARPVRPLLQLRPAVLGGLGSARRDMDPAGGQVLRRLRGGNAAEHHVRRPAVPRRRRRRRRVGGRASARRRAARAGVHVRRGPRLHRVAELGARRAVHRVRRVGRLLRPRAPASVPGRPPQLEHRQRLRADGVPDPGRRRSRRSPSAARSAISCAGSSRSSA